MESEFFKSFHIAGFTYYQGALVFNELSVGSQLEIVSDNKNRYDEMLLNLDSKGGKSGIFQKIITRKSRKLSIPVMIFLKL